MIGKCRMPYNEVVEELEVVSAHAGLTPSDIAFLMRSGMTVRDLLDYVEAVIFERVH
jgi:hypothetical protein